MQILSFPLRGINAFQYYVRTGMRGWLLYDEGLGLVG